MNNRMIHAMGALAVASLLPMSPARSFAAKEQPSDSDDLLEFGPDHTPKVLEELKEAGLPDPGSNPQTLNDLAYKALYVENDTAKALKILRWNLTLMADRMPDFSPVLMDSCAEGNVIAGNRDKAISLWTRALGTTSDLRSSIPDIADHLAKLKADPKHLAEMQRQFRAAWAAAHGGVQ